MRPIRRALEGPLTIDAGEVCAPAARGVLVKFGLLQGITASLWCALDISQIGRGEGTSHWKETMMTGVSVCVRAVCWKEQGAAQAFVG